MIDLTEDSERYIFAIITDSYTGNFERDMCAYVTGQWGDCEVGKMFADPVMASLTDDYIEMVPDHAGCFRPVTMMETPGIADGELHGGVAIFFNRRPHDKLIQRMKERAYEFPVIYQKAYSHRKPMRILDFKLFKQETKITLIERRIYEIY
jgi:hypothetical protein